jgi:hypothetical protein
MGVGPICVGFTSGVSFFHRNEVLSDVCEEWSLHILSHFEVVPCKETPVPTANDTKSLLLTLGEKMPVFQKSAVL